MDYKKIMQKIMAELTQYKGKIDKFEADYQKERGKFEAEMRKMEGKFTAEYISQERKNWKPKTNYNALIDMAKEMHGKNIDELLARIRAQLDSYFTTPANTDLTNIVTGIKSVGLVPKDVELRLLQNIGKGYWDRRILQEISLKRTSKTVQAKLNNENELENVEVNKPIPFDGISVIDIDRAYEVFDNYARQIKIGLINYCGTENGLKDVLHGTKKLSTIELALMVSAEQYFDESYQGYSEFTDMMEKIPKPERKTELTTADKQLIDILIDSRYPACARSKSIEIAKVSPELFEILRLDSRYKDAIEKELGIEEDEEIPIKPVVDSAQETNATRLAQESAQRAAANQNNEQILDNYRR